MAEGLDTGDILCRKELFFDEDKETFASTYEKLLAAMKELFYQNWDAIKAGKITAQKQEGCGTYHTMRELAEIREKHPFTWDCNIADYKNGF